MTDIAFKVLGILSDYVSGKNIELSRRSRDGRVNSAEDEDIIIPYLMECASEDPYFKENGLTLEYPGARYWYDFAINGPGVFIPVNIKTSDLSKGSTDNLNSKESLAYTLTGIRPEEKRMGNWGAFNKVVRECIDYGSEADYYYLVVDKNDTTDVFFNSLKCIGTLTPNGNNLPFQCNWRANKTIVRKDPHEALDYLIDVYKSSLRLKLGAAENGLLAIDNGRKVALAKEKAKAGQVNVIL